MWFFRRVRQLELALAEQRATAAEQHAEIERLREAVAGRVVTAAIEAAPAVHPHHDDNGTDQLGPKRSSRRALLTGGAVTAGAALAGSIVTAKQAAAADGGNLIIGAENLSEEGNTRVSTGAGALLVNRNVFTSTSGVTSSAYPAAVGGTANGGRVTNGVYGYSDHRDTSVNTGHALVGRRESSARSNLLLPPSGTAPTVEAVLHGRGEFRVDDDADLWFCTLGGTPGTWRKLAGPATAGTLHLVAPSRVYDSRFGNQRLATGQQRNISVANRINVNTGVTDLANLVPDRATAVVFNLTITQTVGTGFLMVAPGGQMVLTSSTINWSADAQTLANGGLSPLDGVRQLSVLSGGAGSTHFIIDITGYYV